jgi:Cytochrome b subunit of formate dehydrogenase
MKIIRHSITEIVEHWVVAVSGIMLLFSGIGELPLYKRYYWVLKIPGLGWAGDYFTHLTLHYLFSTFFTGAILFHVLYHGFRGETGLLPRKGDMKRSVTVILAMIGIGKEPPSEKYLPEQRIAYAGMGVIISVLVLTGLFKIFKNIPYIYVPPVLNGVNTLIHTLAAFLFMVALVVHIAVVVVFRVNWPLLKSMFTGKVDEEYVKERHGLWYTELGSPGEPAEEEQTETDAEVTGE